MLEVRVLGVGDVATSRHVARVFVSVKSTMLQGVALDLLVGVLRGGKS